MIKLGSTIINKIKLGSTTINKVFLGANQVYPTGSPGEVLIAGFESEPGAGPLYTGDAGVYAWFRQIDPIVSRTTSNVTENTYSWRIQKTNSGSGVGCSLIAVWDSTPTLTNDFTAYSSIKLDVHVSTIDPVDGYVYISLDDDIHDPAFGLTPFGPSGSYTLEIILSEWPDVDFSNCVLTIGGEGFDAITNLDFYIDNLRGTP